MDKNKNYKNLKKFCCGQGIDLFGVADVSAIKDDFVLAKPLVERLERAVCLGIRLSRVVLEEIIDVPTRLYFHHYRTVNIFLDQLALKVACYIQNKGYYALPIPASQIVDWQKQTGHLSHKKIAILAGLGWQGRNNLLVNKRFGSQIRLVTVLTDMPLRTDKPTKDNCGDCFACIQVCPAQAIKDEPGQFEHMRCFEKLKEFQRQRLVDQYICGICVKVCRGKVKTRNGSLCL